MARHKGTTKPDSPLVFIKVVLGVNKETGDRL
jgi:hypothetical protein